MIIATIPILGSVIDFITSNLINIAGGVGTLVMVIATWAAKKYLIPFLNVESRRRYAAYIAAIADEITDELRLKYPNKPWVAYLDEAVDKIIKVCNISPETARRAVTASLSRK